MAPCHTLDVFNVGNLGAATGYTAASGGSFGVPSRWVSRRMFHISGRLSF